MTFRFASIQRLHEHRRDEVGREVSQAFEAVAKIDERIDEVRTQLEAAKRQQHSISVDRVDSQLAAGRYQLQLKGDLQQLFQTRDQLQVEAQKRVDRLREAQAEVQKFEHLQSIAAEKALADQNQRMQTEIDEFNSRWNRRTST
ncbi:MAG: hypothetical protein AAF664_13120 [Planctomycetota bacterium]